jgi:hypothetical protein
VRLLGVAASGLFSTDGAGAEGQLGLFDPNDLLVEP